MMGLRMKKGISLNKFKNRFNEDLTIKYETQIKKHQALNNLELDENNLKCTNTGFGLLNDILLDFM